METRYSHPGVTALLLLGMILIAGMVPAHAARVGSFLYFWFDPQVLYNDAKSKTTLRVATDNKDIASVWLQTAGSGWPNTWVQLYDDGTHGDLTAGDGTFALNNITSETLGSVTGGSLRYGGSHGEGGFQTKIVKTSGKVQTNWEVGIGMVRAGQVFPAVQLGEGLYATKYAFFIVDPSGKILDAKIPVGSVKCGDTAFGAFEKLYSVFPDMFDIVIVMSAAQIFDPSRNYGENVPYAVPVKNTIENIGMTIFNDNAKFFSNGRLRCMVYHSFGDGQILDHEVGHAWSAWHFADPLGIGETYSAHWASNTDIGGQMSSYVSAPGGRVGHLFDNGDGTWRIEREPGDNEPYSQLDLYLMGLVPASEVPPVHKLISPNYSNPDRVTAKRVETYTIEQLMDAEGGPRAPTSQHSPRTFRIAFIAVKNKAFTPAEFAWFSLVAKYFTSREQGDQSLTTFYTATGGRATLNARLPVQIPKWGGVADPGNVGLAAQGGDLEDDER